MMKALLEDLLFFIGAFFLIIGSLLVFAGLSNPEITEGYNLNLWTGGIFLVFAVTITTLSIRNLKRSR